MPAESLFDYAIVRVVPCVEREEFLNAGVILFCKDARFLDAKFALDSERLATFAPALNPEVVRAQLDLIRKVCAGKGVGIQDEMNQGERFRWLTAPRSTVIQASAVHTGFCADPVAMLDHLVETMVRTARPLRRSQLRILRR